MINVRDDELRPSRHLVVAFAGVMHGYGGIPFEFIRTLGKVDCAALYVRDLGQRWYQYSRVEIDGLADRIRRAKMETGADKLTMLGNSMGGFGALMFGALCDADVMLAFVPQSAIAPEPMRKIGDARYDQWTSAISDFPVGDLIKLPRPRGQAIVYTGDQEPLDLAHARRLTLGWNAEGRIIPGAGHDVAARLRDGGELDGLIGH